jgi:ABC-type transport system involved in cytochrome c biogenesis permease subunit
MIIASYALIAMAFVIAGMYLVGRLLTKPTPTLWLSMLIPAVVIPLPAILFDGISLTMMSWPWMPFLIVLAAAVLAYAVKWIGGRHFASRSYSVWEGGLPGIAPTLVSGGGRLPDEVQLSTPARKPGRKEGLAKILDGSTMLLLELSFITLWTGIIMGAVWADHSWGRPWGWDPKEVFALNTWIIFLILVHVRIKVVDKGLWTAVLAVIGCAVMMFNWVVVNFFITGLHSYA